MEEPSATSGSSAPTRRTGWRRALYVLALGLFFGTAILAYRSLPPLRFEYSWLLLTLAFVPLAMILSGLEYRLSSAFLGQGVSLGKSVRIAVLGSAANLLPIPGAVLVRTQALRTGGAGWVPALRYTAAIGVGWVAAAFLMGAGFLLTTSGGWTAWAFLLMGLAVFGALLALLRGAAVPLAGAAARVLILEGAFVLVAGVRMFGAMRAIGYDGTPTQAVALTLAGALASAAGVFPGGLGLREVLAGALSPLLGLPAAVGALAAALDRVVGVSVLGLTALFLTLRPDPLSLPEDPTEGDAGQ